MLYETKTVALSYARKGWKVFPVTGVSETLCMRLSPRGFDGSSVEPFWV